MYGNTCDNSGNTRGNDSNTHGKPCQLKLNGIDYHINCHVRFGAQIGTQIGISSTNDWIIISL